jgi:hypothetical protein
MSEMINEKVSIITSFNRESSSVSPKKMRWQGRDYLIQSVSYHHLVREGKRLFHIFHCTDGSSDFRLRLDTETLHWTLEEVYDDSTA